MSWSTSELRVRLAPLNRFKPSSKIFYWPFQGGTSFVDLLCFCSVLCLLCFVRVCLYVLCGHLLGKGWPLGSRLWCLLWVCHFPIGILGQVWYLIVSIPDLCNLITLRIIHKINRNMFPSKIITHRDQPKDLVSLAPLRIIYLKTILIITRAIITKQIMPHTWHSLVRIRETGTSRLYRPRADWRNWKTVYEDTYSPWSDEWSW